MEADGPSEAEVNFTFPKLDVVHDENWDELQAQGFSVLWPSAPRDDNLHLLYSARIHHGIENVYTGDAIDLQTGRPSPADHDEMGIYLGPPNFSS